MGACGSYSGGNAGAQVETRVWCKAVGAHADLDRDMGGSRALTQSTTDVWQNECKLIFPII